MIDQENLKTQSDLTSGTFYNEINGLSKKTVSQIADPEQVVNFFEVLLSSAKNLTVFHIDQKGKKNEIVLTGLNEDKSAFKLDKQYSVQKSDTVFFCFLNRTHCFFVEEASSENLIIPKVIYNISRRFWYRYEVSKEVGDLITVKDGDGDFYNIINICNHGLLLSTEKKDVELYINVQLSLNYDGEKYQFEGEYVHIDETTKKIGLSIIRNQDYIKFYQKFSDLYFSKVTLLSEKKDQDKLIKLFENSVFPSLPEKIKTLADKAIEENSISKTYLLRDKQDTIASISTHLVNDRTCFINTLGISKDSPKKLPLDLFDKIADDVLNQLDRGYIIGIWPSHDKLLDRTYTAFAKSLSSARDRFYSVTNAHVFSCDEVSAPAIDTQVEVVEYNYQYLNEVLKLIKKSFQDSFINAFALEDYLFPNRNNNSIKIHLAIEKNKIVGLILSVNNMLTPDLYTLANQNWICLESKVANKQAIQSLLIYNVSKYYQVMKQSTFTVFGKGSLNSKGARLEAFFPDVNYLIFNSTLVKRFLNFLRNVEFEVAFFEKHKDSLSPSLVKKLRVHVKDLLRRQSARIEGKPLDGISGVRVNFSDVNVPAKIISFDTFGGRLSYEGFKSPKKGDRITIDMVLGGKQVIQLSCEIKYIFNQTLSGYQKNAWIIGFVFEVLDEQNHEIIKEYLFENANPELHYFSKDEFDEFINLLDRSNYLDYFDSSRKKKLTDESYSTYEKISEIFPDLARVTVLKKDSKVIGTHSFYRRAWHTWQLHQLVVDESMQLYKESIPTKVILKSSFEYLSLDKTAEYFVTYFSDTAAIAKVYFDVRNHVHSVSDCSFNAFYCYLFNDLQALQFKDYDEYVVSEANDKDYEILQGYLESLVPKIEYDAYDFGDLQQKKFNLKWKERKFQRERKALLLKNKQGAILHFAILNISPQGINLIGAVDSIRFFDVPWYGVQPEKLSYQYLAYKCAEYYNNIGRSQVYLEFEPELKDFFEGLNAHSCAKNWRLTANRDTFLVTMNYFINRFERFEKRLLRRKNA
ncbi:MAG TPA: PilZ domain-containing protein [Oligoflexia bacterium]|nr:PilZ domain-containing protein [Oligoflexia bacterium]HMR24510.1 PilZ domain-containing protein [Oligoflexia bacterium]